MNIPVFKTYIRKEEVIPELEKIFETGWIGLGSKTAEFEKLFAEYVSCKFAVGVNSCTAALHLSLASLDIKPADEVIVPSLTFVSTALVALYLGATPVFADVDYDTLCIDVEDIKRKITKRTKVIIPVHYGGHPCMMDEIWEIAEKYNLYVIEDAAHACGAEYKDKRIGCLQKTILTCFSFHAVKNLPTGDGGMITTNDQNLYSRLIKLRWLGIDKSTWQRAGEKYTWRYSINELGYKYHMNDITAVIGIVQLKHLEEDNKKRRNIAYRYKEALKEIEWIKTPVEKDYAKSAWHNYVIKVPEKIRDKLIIYLASKGISTSVHYEPLHFHKVFKSRGITANLPVTERVWKQLVTLPLYSTMTDEEFEYIISNILEFSKNEM
jgi:perosamine synthetase